MAQNKSNGISLANIIATIGIVILLVFLFLGYFYSGDNLGIAILKASAWTAGFGILLWLLIKAKGADADLMKWRVIEGILLFLYIIIAVLSSNKVARFATIYASSDELKTAATEDIRLIRQGIETFQATENAALTNTITGLELASQGEVSDSLMEFVNANGFELTTASIANFKDKWQDRIENVTDQSQSSFYDAWDEELERCSEQIQGWSVLKIPEAVATMKDLAPQVTAKLEEISAGLPFPVIYKNEADVSDIVKNHEANAYPIAATFANRFIDMSSYSIIGIIICIVIHVMILFNYLVAYRTKRNRIKTNKNIPVNDGGLSI
jgi:hypothetical protein